MVAQPLAARGRVWCDRRGVGFGVLLEVALPEVLALPEVRGGSGSRVKVGFRVDRQLWGDFLDRCAAWPAAPGHAVDHAIRVLVGDDDHVPFDLT